MNKDHSLIVNSMFLFFLCMGPISFLPALIWFIMCLVIIPLSFWGTVFIIYGREFANNWVNMYYTWILAGTKTVLGFPKYCYNKWVK